ncbi:MAG: Type 1 glutamine amidotransferase-like domain-containing protein [Pseudomonadales bacterium]|nr:Type 1 glutamine amidotransferase-like domain-containing protein [Pseudomonadales bacterium]
MKLLLTSGGIQNPSIHRAMTRLLTKPISECKALCIPTAGYGHPMVIPERAWEFISGHGTTPMSELGWKSVGVLELTALPTIDKDRWISWLTDADVLLVNGGDARYLAYWMRESGFAEVLRNMDHLLWIGLSAGSMVMTPRLGEEFVSPNPLITGDDSGLGWVDFSIFPHVEHPMLPDNTMAAAEEWAARLGTLAYVIDDDTAISVVDGQAEVISEGLWRRIEPPGV